MTPNTPENGTGLFYSELDNRDEDKVKRFREATDEAFIEELKEAAADNPDREVPAHLSNPVLLSSHQAELLAELDAWKALGDAISVMGDYEEDPQVADEEAA